MRQLFDKIKDRTSWIKINKYYLTVLVFLTLTFGIGDSTLSKRFAYNREISKLKKEIEVGKKQKEENTQKLEALRSDNESLEKFAREQYFMAKPDEDIFIIESN